MRKSILILGMVLASLLSGALSLAFVSAEESPEPPATPSLVVPFAKTGDLAEYLRTGYYHFVDNYNSDDNDTRLARFAIRVGPTVRVPDNLGVLRTGVQVEYDGNNAVTVQNVFSSIVKEVVDVETRDLLLRARAFQDTLRGTSQSQVIGPLFYSTGTPAAPNEQLLRLPGNDYFSFQGLDFTLGQDLRQVLPNEAAPASVHEVAFHGRFSGQPALGLLKETRIDSREATSTFAAYYREISWFTAQQAFPVLREYQGWERYRDASYDYDTRWDYAHSLVRFTHGTVPVPWAAEPVMPQYAVENPRLERSPRTQLHPADGTGIMLAYPLSRALAAVAGDPSLPAFRVWKASNPTAILVGAEYRPVQDVDQARGQEWILTYAAPGQDTAFRVRTLLPDGSPQPIQHEAGAVLLRGQTYDRRIPETPLPGGPITLAEAARLWRLAMGPGNETRVPTHILWGYGGLDRCVANVPNPETPDQRCFNNVFANAAQMLARLEVGDSQGVRVPVRPAGAPSLPVVSDYASFNATAGFLRARSTRAEAWDFQSWSAESLGLNAESAPPAGQWKAVEGASPYERAAWVSGSLLALLLGVYLLPVLRDIGASLLIEVPLYAKLRKSKVLDHKTREALMTAIKADPGLNLRQLHQRVGGGWSTIVYHVRVLNRNRLVSVVRDGRHRRIFPGDAGAATHHAQASILKNEKTQAVFQRIRDGPAATRLELARHVGLSVAGILWHVERLERAGLISSRREGRSLRYAAPSLPASASQEPLAALASA